MRKREGDGCPVAGALQLVGDKWTLLIVRDLAGGPRRTTELIDGLYPISSRTLVDRLRDMDADGLVQRTEFEGQPPHVEYRLTDRGLRLLPLVDELRKVGQDLGCNECEDRRERLGIYCEACPLNEPQRQTFTPQAAVPPAPQTPSRRREQDDSIVLL
ncbi:MAG TPA: helix-turn-helix domain-containing protein [Pyrinomonadaceae bacterium]|nr:helix-turn-helix domain-containing protein [Pyrinomonadaceae bacterium]